MQFVFLSPGFYSAHVGDAEIEQKATRPHARVLLPVEGVVFAIPFRSNIQHPYAYLTDKENKCGLDYSKAVPVIDAAADIDNTAVPHIRQNEFNALKGKDRNVEIGMRRYLRCYQKAKENPDNKRNAKILECSTLKYFDDVLPDVLKKIETAETTENTAEAQVS